MLAPAVGLSVLCWSLGLKNPSGYWLLGVKRHIAYGVCVCMKRMGGLGGWLQEGGPASFAGSYGVCFAHVDDLDEMMRAAQDHYT